MEKHGILLVVAGALVDLKGPVDLLQKHHPCQVVGEGHGGHRELEPSLLLDGGVQAIGAADEKDQMLGGGLLPIGHDLGQFLTGAQLSLHTEGYQTGAGWEAVKLLLFMRFLTRKNFHRTDMNCLLIWGFTTL